MMLNAQQLAQFHNQGFVILDDVFARDALNDIERAMRHLVWSFLDKAEFAHPGIAGSVEKGDELDGGLAALEAADHAYVAQLYDTMSELPALLRLHGGKDLSAVVNQLFGKDTDAPLYTYTKRLRIDPPQDDRRTYGWHQEVFYTMPGSRFIQLWAPAIHDATLANGTIEVCPGSHLDGIAEARWEQSPGRALQVRVVDEVVKKYRPIRVEMELGQALLFSGRTIHRSGSNTSDKIRFSIIGMFHDVDHRDFRPAKVSFDFHGMTPREFFEREFAERHEDQEVA